MGVWFHYASSSLAFEGEDALSAVKDALTVYGAEPFVAVRLTNLGPEGVLRVTGGPLVEVWKLPDLGSRTRIGAAAALELAMPFGGRWSGVARIGGAVTPGSPPGMATIGAPHSSTASRHSFTESRRLRIGSG